MKIRYILQAAMVICMSCQVMADINVRRASPAAYVDPEMPFRCMLPGTDKQVSNTIVLTPDDFSFISLQSGDMLPRYAVNGYTFHNKPIDAVLSDLLKSAGIKVLAPQTEYTLLDGKNVKGELSSVVEQLADAGEIFYSYKESTKTLTLLRRTEFALTVPQNKVVLLAVLDALRGSEIENLNVDWEKYQIRMSVSPEELQKAKKIVRQILDDSYLLAADIEGYQAIPYQNSIAWQGVLNESTGLLSSIGRAMVGRPVVLKSKTSVDSFLARVEKAYQLTPLVAGQAVVPNGWQMRFNVNECANNTLPYPNMSIVMKTRIKDQSSERTQVTLVSAGSTVSSFDVSSALNQEVALIGIPTKVGNAELMFTLKFNLIRFIQKGE
ncbi:MAG: hypothetical protein II938_00765 [Alphaproteobacteria bacterium]|nr:hypothetical protein [Alphaproteobacteria bacterium]